ncbi:MAG: hypothetical protein KF891_20760 [Rhizobacter sp.]|nr:hypothetical protein [Rhizobacter sp.]
MIFDRYKAFGAHLLASLVAALGTSALVFLVWYPGVLADATGVSKIFLILLTVDVVIGPLVTLIVFNPAKRELRRDLLIVLLLQIGALLYGLHAVWMARPVYVVFNADRFDLVFANDLDKKKLAKARIEQFRTLPYWGPEIIGAKPPADAKRRMDILVSALGGGDDIAQMPEYYVPYKELAEQISVKMKPLSELIRHNPTQKGRIEALSKRFVGENVNYLPLRGKVRDLVVLVNGDSGNVLEFADLEPW